MQCAAVSESMITLQKKWHTFACNLIVNTLIVPKLAALNNTSAKKQLFEKKICFWHYDCIEV